jgi:hypothetical protein
MHDPAFIVEYKEHQGTLVVDEKRGQAVECQGTNQEQQGPP